jgi:hypothetical protein
MTEQRAAELRQAVVFAARFELYTQRFTLRSSGAELVHPVTIQNDRVPADWRPIENPARVREYWADVLPAGTPLYDYPKEWCGALCLFVLHRAELALDVFWKGGFLARRCRLLHASETPQPGDMAFFERYQHHAIVEAVDAERRTFDSIDGNQAPGIVRRAARPFAAVKGFYSIDPLIEAKEAERGTG